MAPLGRLSSSRMSEEALKRNLDAWFSQFGPVLWLAGRCGVEPWVVGVTSLLWMVGFLLWGFTGELICTVLGLLYPMYASFRALEDSEHCEVIEWMLYWVTYAAVTLIESVFHGILVWVPFYHVLRLGFALWLFTPSTRGARSVYSWVIAPLLRRHRPAVDAALAKSSEELQATEWSQELRSKLKTAMGAAAPEVAKAALGMDDLVAEELAKSAACQMGQLAGQVAGKALVRACGAEAPGAGRPLARPRTASPRPSLSRAPAAE